MRSTLLYYTVAEVAITTTTTICTTTAAMDMTTSNAAVVWVSCLIAAIVSFSLSYIIYCLLDKNNNNSYNNNVYNITILLWFIFIFFKDLPRLKKYFNLNF